MDRDPLVRLREARVWMAQWLEVARKLPDPSAHPPETVPELASRIESVGFALRSASSGLAVTDEWKREIAAYTDVLRELRARLSNFEMTLRIRQNQRRGAQGSLSAVRSWSDLAKSIG
ncbi:MAG TPA: hypothetical protein VJN69_05740 [Candidatus Acidoferrales bacterium]|nr:hypothetical protein [Candidatus Acidoferrales bacterium]